MLHIDCKGIGLPIAAGAGDGKGRGAVAVIDDAYSALEWGVLYTRRFEIARTIAQEISDILVKHWVIYLDDNIIRPVHRERVGEGMTARSLYSLSGAR